jgi:outer membrane protein assembly factor BamE (lipoprotein component of BamABCDE complex)
MRQCGLLVLCLTLTGCAFQRAEIAQDARAQMIGMSKEQVLACMGTPANKAIEGATEAWGYNSGNGTTVVSATYDRFGGEAFSHDSLLVPIT